MSQGIFTWVGQWLGSPLSTNVYYKNDVVKYNNIVYICVAAVSVPVGSQNPSVDSSNWNVMVTGFSGSSGSSGSSGTSGSGGGSSIKIFGPTGEVSAGATGIIFLGSGVSSVVGLNDFVTVTISGGTGSGTSGTSGESGTSGTSGTSGESGTSGTSGTSGESGTSGTSGTSGESGTSGTSGTSGESGTSGTSGTSGESGTSGTSGSSGTSGVNGSSGTSGTDGAPGAGGAIGYYGSFYDTTVQTNAGATAANAFKYDTTDINNGVSIVSQSRITIANPGIYDIQFSAQVDKTDAGEDYINIWLSKNGVNVPNTDTTLFLPKNDAKSVAAWNFLVEATAPNDYFELYWASTDIDMRIYAQGPSTNPTRPAIPSIILTVTQVMYTQVGPTGASGTSGTSGTSGVSGSSGTSGLNGSSGTSGTSGSSGTSGLTLLTISNKTTDYTVTAADYTSMLIFTSGTTSYLTIDSDANTNPNFPIGGKFQIVRGGTGEVGVTGPGTVTINSVQNKKFLTYQWSEVSAVKTAADTWLLYGGLTGEYVPPSYTLTITNNSTTGTVTTGLANSTTEPAAWTTGSYPVSPGQFAGALVHQAYTGSGASQLQFSLTVPTGPLYWILKKNGTTLFGPVGPIVSNTTAFMGGMSATTSDIIEFILSDTP